MSEAQEGVQPVKGRDYFKKYGPICTSEGFYQHTGQCWSDALQMLMVYTDGIKEFTQRKLATQDVEFKEIEIKFEPIVREKLKSIQISTENSRYTDLKNKNLRAIFLYFKAVQERFRRHYMAEIERFEHFGPVKCYSFEKMGQESLETLKKIALSYRSQDQGVNKPGVQSAIMGKSGEKYLKANRELIGKSKNFKYGKGNKTYYETGGSNEEIEYLIKIYSIYFDIELNFGYELIENHMLNKINTNESSHFITIRNSPTRGHAICFFECGKKEYYYDDNEGVIIFPWRQFFSYFNTFMDKKMKDSSIFINIIFAPLFQVIDKKTGNIFIQTHTYPFIQETKLITYENRKVTWHTVLPDFKDPISIEFPDEVIDRFHNTVIKKYETKYENDDTIYSFFFTPKDDIFKLESFMSIKNSTKGYEKSTYNINTGQILTSRLKTLNTNMAKAILTEDKNTIKKLILQKTVKKNSQFPLTNSVTGKVLVPGVNYNNRAPDIVERDKEGNTVVHLAVNLKDLDFLKWLLENADVNVNRRNADGNTPLALAILNKQYDMVEFLIRKGADINIKNNDNLLPIDMLIGENNLTNSPESFKLIEFLFSLSSNPIAIIKNNLFYTFIQENIPLFDLFFRYGLNNNEKMKLRDSDFTSYLTVHAYSARNINLFKYFLSKGIDKEQKEYLLEAYKSRLEDDGLLEFVEQATLTQGGARFSQTRKNSRTNRIKKRKTRKH